ncbi:MAG: tetratricopeptide repeat protein, partial [Xanthomonadales bacterium]|nr:tetratricopeptide repeat protein [Xanthomonadales bacterium]NIX12867.1 tetratricopeptide repeat protein [Xanthomonadales bacterium]
MTGVRTLIILAGLACLALPGQAPAQAQLCGEERGITTQPLDEPTWRRLNRAYEMVAEEDYASAYEELSRMYSRARDNYLRAVLAQGLAQVQWALEDFDASLRSFEEAVGLDVLPDQTHFSLMYQIAQLYYMQERYREALDKLDLWFCKVNPEQVEAPAWVLKASIHAQAEEWLRAIEAIDVAIGMEPEPQESWYQLRLAGNFEMNDYPAAADTLEIMVTHWPDDKTYWLQLSNTYYKLERYDQALSSMALAYRKGLLDEQSDFLYLSNLYSLQDVPFKAADVMQKGVERGLVEPSEKHWTIIANAWYAAEELENALAGYERAGRAALDGEIDLRRGYILIDLERWEEARAALSQAIEKGGINDRKLGEAHLMVGMAEFNLGNFDDASAAWGRASRFEQSKRSA